MFPLLPMILLALSLALPSKTLDEKIANMFVLGFYGTEANASGVLEDVCRRGLGGVILFDRYPGRRKEAKNIRSPRQLRRLTRRLLSCRHQPLIAVDEEGGRVQRLRKEAGFHGRYPSAAALASMPLSRAEDQFAKMAGELSSVGINYDLAPVADLAINPHNVVINRMQRSFGRDPEKVTEYDAAFIRAMHKYGILTALKHFPGHGSSLGDTHKGFVDVTSLWSAEELEPYRRLIRTGAVDSIMVAHIFNRRLDPKYPASLSRKTVEALLRKRLGYDGVVISDDLQMGAIVKRYSLEETIRLAIEAGDDLLLFGNQLDPRHTVTLDRLVAATRRLLRQGKISARRIESANRRIDRMKRRIGLRP